MQLQIFIKAHFPNQREFVKAFNAAGGMLTEQQLSRHLNGRRGLSKGWRSAYSLYFGGRVTPEDILKENGFDPEKYVLCIADFSDVVVRTIDEID
mgnify:FL=1